MRKLKRRPSSAVNENDISGYNLECDVAVVGFGVVGACAAIESADLGATVHIFELASAAGKSTALSGWDLYLGGSGVTHVQRCLGFEDASDDMFGYLMMQQGLLADEVKT